MKIPIWIPRLILTILGVIIWFWTQALLGSRLPVEGQIVDKMHIWTDGINQFLFQHALWANALLISSSLVLDVFGVGILAFSIWGKTMRPFLALVMALALRQFIQAVQGLPPPEGMIWHHPGFPSLLASYDVGTDFFFSAHTSVVVIAAVELSRLGHKWLTLFGILLASFVILAALALRFHYTMDLFAGVFIALYCAYLSTKIAPAFDRWMDKIFGRGQDRI